MIQDIVDAYRGVDPESMEGLMISKMEDIREQLQEALAEGIYSAGQNYQRTEKIPPARVG